MGPDPRAMIGTCEVLPPLLKCLAYEASDACKNQVHKMVPGPIRWHAIFPAALRTAEDFRHDLI
ncbi:MAG: hypothetical protein C4519_21230 [Desulfobacteraceae bacterium]|nr:MAG: hypothetical protein C4519_21230 [Desulfobacteraceae bacterium]